ncbi:MAG TPA: AAA family ATPase [Spongiibacteraceae bacterium]|nr:AAA family ATPase [Spongiibacteraceae bacterium]HCS26562.1 AAA family ATPase [Spongiibacteraceae bacterium]|tara:strand:+ start:4585 stop:5493 length:909 start_codon:yes stop_codon:yes gene_type:complete
MITDKLIDQVGTILLGKQQQVRLAVCCLLARGHLLIEDLPGVGKTTLAQALMRATGLEYQRVQFTSDLLPADVLGVSIFDRKEGGFQFHPGPIFTQLLLVDEINRASPKTQSALLEAMAECQVTAEGETRQLPSPFFVIATQNPLFQSGTFPLPESQLDRFLMRISLGYPDSASERQLLTGKDPRQLLQELGAVITAEQLLALQAKVDGIEARESVLDYLQRLIAFTRTDSHFAYGLSSRAALALLHCAKAWAMISGRDYVVPEDVQVVLEPVAAHRLRESQSGGDSRSLIHHLLEDVPVVV